MLKDTKQMIKPRDVYIIDGARTPFLKTNTQLGSFSAADLAVYASRSLLLRQPLRPSNLDQVIIGCVNPSEEESNIARIVALRLGCGKTVPAWTVQRNCGSGMQAIDAAAKDIAMGTCDLILAGGTEAMSRIPWLWNTDIIHWWSELRSKKGIPDKFKTLKKFRPSFLTPVSGLKRGLTDPLINLTMGETAEILAHQFNISREAMDIFSMNSHQKALSAQDKQANLAEIIPLYQAKQIYELDNGIRANSNLESLAKLKPTFDKPFGLITAGNSAQITDGAAMLLLASETAVERYALPVLGRIVDIQWAGVSPECMGLGPVYATTSLLQRQQLSLADIDYWEINEAFAAQVLACLAAWQDTDFCQQQLGLADALGSIDIARLNIEGGAIALGHPIGATGARLILHLVHLLKKHQAKRGIATLCIGGGQGGALLLAV